MKKRNLTAAILACALCVATMTGTACSPQFYHAGEADAAAVASAVVEDSVGAQAEDGLDDAAAAAKHEAGKPAQNETTAKDEAETEAAVTANPEGKAGSDPTPSEKAAPQAAVKKPAQSGAEGPKQEARPEAAQPEVAQHEAEAASLEADPDDEIPFVIDAIPADAEEAAAKASTITINGVAIDYVDSFGTSSAPDSGAGLWMGSDSTTDGGMGYFIGHDYTDFGDVANLDHGSTVSVTDGNGDSCDYEVVDSFVVPRGSYWSDISDRVTGHGESIVMQTCVDDGYLIVVAE